jgi:Domain of unknown function (DUF4350)
MAPQLLYYQLTPLVLNQAAPVPPALEARFDSAPTAVKIHFDALNTNLTLTPDATGKVFTGSLPPAALTTGLTAADVNRKFIGHLLVTTGAQTEQYNVFGDVMTAAIPPVTVHPVAADVQFSDHLVNVHLPALADQFVGGVNLQLTSIAQTFFAHFPDEYDFLQLVFPRSYISNRYHSATRNDVQGIGQQLFNSTAQYGSAGRLLGLSMFPVPTLFDGVSSSTTHELGHQWLAFLKFAPLEQGVPHWPISDLATDIMGYSIFANGQAQGGQFNYDLQPVGGGNFKMVPSTSPKTFSDLSLYLMGQKPSNQVGDHFVFDNQAQPIADNGILSGPVTTVTINDVIAHLGARSPDFSKSQKCFRVATILVTKNGLAPLDAMRQYDFFAARASATTPLAYTDGFVKRTARPFSMLTNGVGCLHTRIKRSILVDASRDGGVWWFPQTGPFVPANPHQGHALATHLRGLGHTVRELPRPTAITASLLADIDIVIRVGGDGPYTPAELDAYDAWVKNGGGLLLLAEHHAADALATHFGLQFKGITRGQQVLSTYAPHPLTAGAGPVFYGVGGGLTAHPPSATVLGWLSAATFLDLNDDGVKGAGEPSGPAGLGVMPFGKGKIVFCGDANLWTQVPQPLVKNTLHWFASP